ncbi:hypothetical protein B0A48_11686 [Cryoendolithus antarcticus]|uniref:N-acetyltransferase domain-containing protein n=1 Tax=Cryoendolithus antarcticus TaxID=1507870 RepID=A0A1V8SSY4_9PEZI|nr:hypothetical protein B0A48_11686 [Cryoendolithus antarcticus]
MPQASLMTWLSKSSAVSVPPPAFVRPKRHEALPTPPSSSRESAKESGNLGKGDEHVISLFLKAPARSCLANVTLRAPTKADLPAFKHMNSLLLPIPYPESFYKETISDELTRNITLLAFWHDSPQKRGSIPDSPLEKGHLVGAIRCRLFAHPLGSSPQVSGTSEKPMLYLSTLVVLAPYRGHGIAAHLLETLLLRAVKDYGIGSVGAHVWEANAEGMEWYRKRGFREVGSEKGYYRKLKPDGAVVVRREVGVMDLAGREE